MGWYSHQELAGTEESSTPAFRSATLTHLGLGFGFWDCERVHLCCLVIHYRTIHCIETVMSMDRWTQVTALV
jgi:hypothetical protein